MSKKNYYYYKLKDALLNLGVSNKKNLSPSIYDTSWVCRIRDPNNLPLFSNSIKWILRKQNSDGSWGQEPFTGYNFDKLICTLSVINMLKIWSDLNIAKYRSYISRGVNYIQSVIKEDSIEVNSVNRLVGFELLFINLLEESIRLNIFDDSIRNARLYSQSMMKYQKKLKNIPINIISKVKTTILHSIEAIDPDKINWDTIKNLRDKTGSLLTSPAATAYSYLNTNDDVYLNYLKESIIKDTYFTVGTPLDLFEINWGLSILKRSNLEKVFKTQYRLKLDILINNWNMGKGMSWSSAFNFEDLDDTSVAYDLIHDFLPVSEIDVFNNFFDGNNIFCFPNETDGSPTHLFNFLTAIDSNPRVIKLRRKAIHQLDLSLNSDFIDKWHILPTYLVAIGLEIIIKDLPHKIDSLINFVDSKLENTSTILNEDLTWLIFIINQLRKHTMIYNKLNKENIWKAKKQFRKLKINDLQQNNWIEKTLYKPNQILAILFYTNKYLEYE